MSVKPGIYVRCRSGEIYWKPNTWRTGADLEYASRFKQISDISPTLTQGRAEQIPAFTLSGHKVVLSPDDLVEMWEQTFVGEDSDDTSSDTKPSPTNAGVVFRQVI